MSKMVTRAAVVLLSIASAMSGTCFAQKAKNTGGVPVRIPNEPNPQCINSSTDEVWLTLYRVIETKQNGFLSHENQAEIVVTVNVQTKPQPAKPLTFPLSTKVNIRPYSTGQVSIPVEYPLVSGLDLKQTDTPGKSVIYTGFSVDATLVNLKSAAGLGSALKALSDVMSSGKIPIPDSPYKQAASYLSEFASKAIQNDIDSKNSDDKYSTATLTLNFSEHGNCAGGGPTGQGFETTGTKAIVMSQGTQGEGYVPIDQVNTYCWAADLTPAFTLKAAKMIAGKPCTDPSYAASLKPITNDYLAFFLQKQTTTTGHLGPNPKLQQDIKDSAKLCDLLGVTDCPAAAKKQ